MDLAKQLDPQTIIMDEMFDEVSALDVLRKKIPLDVFQKEKAEKWINIFARNDSFRSLLSYYVSLSFLFWGSYRW